MSLEAHSTPRSHVVVRPFFGPRALAVVKRELAALSPHMRPGLMSLLGPEGVVHYRAAKKRNHTHYLEGDGTLLETFRATLWAPRLVRALAATGEPLWELLPAMWAKGLQIARYGEGDFYRPHQDENRRTNVTAVVMVKLGRGGFDGGELVLRHRGARRAVAFHDNQLVLFPSSTWHEVTPVRAAAGATRFSLQCWPVYRASLAMNEARPGPHRAASDEPTFQAGAHAAKGLRSLARLVRGVKETGPYVDGAFYLRYLLESNVRWLSEQLTPGRGTPPVRAWVDAGGRALHVGARGGLGYRIDERGLALVYGTRSARVAFSAGAAETLAALRELAA